MKNPRKEGRIGETVSYSFPFPYNGPHSVVELELADSKLRNADL